ncbi:MAG: YbaB/EbfC family nucleoid-associated protein [Dehalococcoidia bacterium]
MANRGMSRDMMKQMQQLQARMVEAQKQMEETVMEASVGGGAVSVTMNARPKLLSVSIDPEVVDAEEVEMLQDLVTAAVNEALEKISAAQSQQLSGLTGGLNIPGL